VATKTDNYELPHRLKQKPSDWVRECLLRHNLRSHKRVCARSYPSSIPSRRGMRNPESAFAGIVAPTHTEDKLRRGVERNLSWSELEVATTVVRAVVGYGTFTQKWIGIHETQGCKDAFHSGNCFHHVPVSRIPRHTPATQVKQFVNAFQSPGYK